MTARPIEGYRFYAAIRSQPAELARLLKASEPVDLAAEALGEAKRVFCLGLGASLHTASVVAGLLGRAAVDARAWSSADFAHYPPAFTRDDAALVFLDAETAERTRGAIEALGRKRSPVVLVGARGAHEAWPLPMGTTVLRTGVEDASTVATVAQTASILLAARVADAIASAAMGDLAAVPAAVEVALGLEDDIESLAHEWRGKRMLIALGAGPHEPIAHAAATLIASAAGRLASGHSVEEFLSGQQAAFHDDDAIVAFASAGAGLGRTREAVERARGLGCEGAWVSAEAPPRGTLHLVVPDVGEALAPIVQIVPAQLLAGHLATVTDAGDARGARIP